MHVYFIVYLNLNVCILSWQESYDKTRQCVKSRDVNLPTKVHIVKVMVFPVVTYSCEN